MTGLIYKYTNNINGKIYVGQTRQQLQKHHDKHLQQLNDHTYFHRALKKYGIENFTLEIIEDNIPLEQLDEKEIYWIKKLDSYCSSGKGYNETKGGQWGTSNQLLSGSQEEEIKQKLKNNLEISLTEIAKYYNVSLSCISDINVGKTFYDKNINYPIRKTATRSKMTKEIVDKVISLLKMTNETQDEIASLIGIHSYTVGEINRGYNSWCPSNLSYPIRKPIKSSTYQNILNLEKVKQIVYDLIYTNETIENIGKKYGVSKNTVGDISRGISWKEITLNFICPIRKNKLINQEKYESLYGIV